MTLGRRATVVAPLVALLIALLVSGCGGQKGPTGAAKKDDQGPVSVAAGQCFGGDVVGDSAESLAGLIKTDNVDALKDDPTWRDPVDCAKAHKFEVYGLVGLPPAVDKQVTKYAQLLDTESPLFDTVRTAVNRQCSLQLPGVRKAMKKSRMLLLLSPAINSDVAELGINPLPHDNWEAGQRQFACLLSLTKKGTETMADFLTAKGAQSALHVCYDANTQAVACDQPHTLESVAIITANEAVAAKQLPAADGFVNGQLQIGPNKWDELDKVCTTFLNANSKGHPGLTGVTSVFNSQWPVPNTENYAFFCDATSPPLTPKPKLTSTTGSVFNK